MVSVPPCRHLSLLPQRVSRALLALIRGLCALARARVLVVLRGWVYSPQDYDMVVSWLTGVQTPTSTVKFGTVSGTYTNAGNGTSASYYKDNFVHHVVLTGLQPATKYYYVCGDEEVRCTVSACSRVACHRSHTNTPLAPCAASAYVCPPGRLLVGVLLHLAADVRHTLFQRHGVRRHGYGQLRGQHGADHRAQGRRRLRVPHRRLRVR